MMTETKEKAFDVLESLYAKQVIAETEYIALKSAILEGPPFGDREMRYTVFLIDMDFTNIEDPRTGLIRFDNIDSTEIEVLMRLAMNQDFDFVIRRYEDEE